MVNFDFSPLYRRVDQRGDSYPPYNIESTGEDAYRITMAVAGFDKSELNIEARENTLTISGVKNKDETKNFLYQGIAERNFERRFQLADHVKVVSAKQHNGLRHVDLVREIPEAKKPRTIQIEIDNSKLIEG